MTSFNAYGLTIESELRLPELDASRADPDVRVRLGDVPASPDEPVTDGRLYRVDGGHFVTFDHIGSLYVEDGRRVVVEPADGVDEEVLRQLVLGRGLRILLHQRGYVVLHASSAVVDGEAVAFLGDSGQGKSTTVAGFYGEGHPVLADDVTAVDPETAEVLPGFQQVKLDRRAVEGVETPLTPTNASDLARQYYAVADSPGEADDVPDSGGEKSVGEDSGGGDSRGEDSGGKDPVALRRIYLLTDGPAIRIESIPPSGRPYHVMRSSTSAHQSAADEGLESHFEDCVRLGAAVPVKRLQRPREYDALPEVVRAVEADLADSESDPDSETQSVTEP